MNICREQRYWLSKLTLYVKKIVVFWENERMMVKITLTGKMSSLLRNFSETDSSASCGHSWNQSIYVQFMVAGNLRPLFRKIGPTGEKQRTIFKCRRTLSMKNFQQFSLVSAIPVLLTYCREKMKWKKSRGSVYVFDKNMAYLRSNGINDIGNFIIGE